MKMVALMLQIVATAFVGKEDKAGLPYFMHCYRVMLNGHTLNPELMCILLGHDLFEDTDITPEYLRARGFSERVIRGISDMTKLGGTETYEMYKAKVMSNIDSILAKMADIEHNTDLSRLKGVTDKDHARVARYHVFYKELEKAKREWH